MFGAVWEARTPQAAFALEIAAQLARCTCVRKTRLRSAGGWSNGAAFLQLSTRAWPPEKCKVSLRLLRDWMITDTIVMMFWLLRAWINWSFEIPRALSASALVNNRWRAAMRLAVIISMVPPTTTKIAVT